MDFVSFEIAKKLKEKGYGESWDYVYNDDGVICIPCYNLTEEDTIPMCPAPQIHEVLKWLREETKINVSMRLYKENGWYYTIQNYKGEPLYSQLTNTDELYPYYEQAAIAGIEYVLDNLI